MSETVLAPPRRPFKYTEVVPPWVTRLLLIAAGLLIWEISARLWVDPMFLSPPSKVIAVIGPLFETEGVPSAILKAFVEVSIAFTLSVVFGLLTAMFVGLNRFSYVTLMPIIILLYAVPQSTILPLFAIVFGAGAGSKIAYGFTHGIFPVTVTVIAALQNIRPIYLRTAKSMGASRYQVLRHVVFPYVLPSFFTGLRLSMTSTLVGVLLAELYVSENGIGYFSRLFGLGFDPAKLFALMAVIAALAIVINESLRRLELRHSRWKN